MKTRTEIIELTHDDLVELFSTATYGSEWLTIRKPIGTYKGTDLEDDNDCSEDTWAKVLLAGKKLYAYDFFAEDETDSYGTLPHKWDKEDEAIVYEFGLDDLKKGLQACLDNGSEYEKKCAMQFVDYEDGEFDICAAETIMQRVLFNEQVYG